MLDRLERHQSYIIRLVPEIPNLSYTERLKKLNQSSIQRRFDRYRLVYTRKVLLDQVPNPGITVQHQKSVRLGFT